MHTQDAVATLASMVLVITAAFPVPWVLAASLLSFSILGERS